MIEDGVVHGRLTYIARLFDDPPAFGLPIFTNVPGDETYFIQSIAPDGTISAFVPVDVSDLLLHAVDKPIERKIGNRPLLAFETGEDAFKIGERASLKSELKQFLTYQIWRDCPFTRAAVANFCEDPDAAWGAELDAAERLADTAETQKYYRIGILARQRIILELHRERQSTLPPFRIRETDGRLEVELPEGTTEDQFIRMRSAVGRCERDLKTLTQKGKFSWVCRIVPRKAGKKSILNEDSLHGAAIWPPRVADNAESHIRSLNLERIKRNTRRNRRCKQLV